MESTEAIAHTDGSRYMLVCEVRILVAIHMETDVATLQSYYMCVYSLHLTVIDKVVVPVRYGNRRTEKTSTTVIPTVETSLHTGASSPQK